MVAIKYETKLEDLVGKKNAAIMRKAYWDDVVSIMLTNKDIVIAFGAGTSHDSFCQMMFIGDEDWKKQFEVHHSRNPGKFISASDDPKKFSPPPHPCSIYQRGKQSNMEMKLSKVDIFYTNVKLAHDPSARPCEFGRRFWDSNSSVFEFLQLAYLEEVDPVGRNRGQLWRGLTQERNNWTMMRIDCYNTQL